MPVDALHQYRIGSRPETAYGIAADADRDVAADQAEISQSALYSSRIIKAGALLADTHTLLANWDEAKSVADNLERLQNENLFGKASRSRIRDILAIFRQRYLRDESVTAALTFLVKHRFPKPALDRVLYYHSVVADKLLHDTVTDVVAGLYFRGRVEITVVDVQKRLREWVREGKTADRWSEGTTVRVAQGLLSTLRDFGVLHGANKKRIAPPNLPISAFSYIAFDLHRAQPSGERLIHSSEWELFFLSTGEVEQLFIEAHQRRLLEYYAAGPVIRINFPSESLEDYARVVAERAL